MTRPLQGRRSRVCQSPACFEVRHGVAQGPGMFNQQPSNSGVQGGSVEHARKHLIFLRVKIADPPGMTVRKRDRINPGRAPRSGRGT